MSSRPEPPEPLDPLEAAVVFAIREAARLRRERAAAQAPGERTIERDPIQEGRSRRSHAA